MTTDTKAAAPRPPVISVLENARALVRERWAQGPELPPGTVCAAIAIGQSIPNLAQRQELYWRARTLLVAAAGAATGGLALTEWNDTPGRTQAEVLAAIDRAIAVERGTATEGSP